MSLDRICQRCGERESHWNVHESRIEVGEVSRKDMLCRECTTHIQTAIVEAFKNGATDGR